MLLVGKVRQVMSFDPMPLIKGHNRLEVDSLHIQTSKPDDVRSNQWLGNCVKTDMNVTTDSLQVHHTIQTTLSALPFLFFLYVNCVMLFALVRKPVLLESSRYILFGHLLCIESFQLTVTMLLYIFSVVRLRLISHMCVTITLMGSVTLQTAPLNLALMSLERYVAICFPLRHSSIATPKATGIAIIVMWALSSISPLTQLFLLISLENTTLTLEVICARESIFKRQIYDSVRLTFIVVYFVLVAIVIIFTYVAVLVTVKSKVSNVSNSSSKAHKTVLLHLFQLCLCLTSTLFGMIDSGIILNANPKTVKLIRYLLFMGLLNFPKFLSPLIYGLRDPAFSHVFKYYFTFGIKTRVRPHPKSGISV